MAAGRLAGKVALVTGASSGIGRAIARTLAQDGMRLMLCARRLERLETLQAELKSEHPQTDIEVQRVDLRDTAQILHLFETLRARWDGVDVLINNAGLGRYAPLMEGPIDAWKTMLDVNVLALSVCTQQALQDMRRRGDHGHVVHISSMAAHRVLQSGMYAATKFAVRALTEGLRRELRHAGSQIRVCAISPGYVETEFAEHYHGNSEAAAQTYGRYPCLQPNDVADAVRHVLHAPDHVEFHDLLLRPTAQPD